VISMWVQHDFRTDPITFTVDGEWLKARGTTLGADNGLGAAAGALHLVLIPCMNTW
jgi:di/tripeptidase